MRNLSISMTNLYTKAQGSSLYSFWENSGYKIMELRTCS